MNENYDNKTLQPTRGAIGFSEALSFRKKLGFDNLLGCMPRSAELPVLFSYEIPMNLNSYNHYHKIGLFAVLFVAITPVVVCANPIVLGVYGVSGIELFFFIPTVVIEFFIIAKILKTSKKTELFKGVFIIHLISYPLTVIAGMFFSIFAEIIPISIEYCYYVKQFNKLKKLEIQQFCPTKKRLFMACLIANIATFIIGIALSITIHDMTESNYILRAKQNKAEADIMVLNAAIKSYKFDNKMVPSPEQGLNALVSFPKIGPIPTNWKKGGYLEKNKLPKDPWGNEYIYISYGKDDEFDIQSFGFDGVPGGIGKNKDINSWEIE